MERTLSIIKPNAVKKGHVGEILSRFEQEGLRIVALRMHRLSEREARAFYAVHAGRPFFESLVAFMTSGPSVVLVLEGSGVIDRNREIMGATDPARAAPGTLRARFADDVTRNAVHGSDAPETASAEIRFFFAGMDLPERASVKP